MRAYGRTRKSPAAGDPGSPFAKVMAKVWRARQRRLNRILCDERADEYFDPSLRIRSVRGSAYGRRPKKRPKLSLDIFDLKSPFMSVTYSVEYLKLPGQE